MHVLDGRVIARSLLLALAFLATSTSAVPAEPGAAPELVTVCASCHGEKGLSISHPNAPLIAGIPAQHFEEALFSYQDGARTCAIEPALCAAVSALSEEQIIQLADYFSAIPRVDSAELFNPTLAEIGEVIHNDRCARCHVRPDDEDSADSLGIPLHGQRSAYLSYALEGYLEGRRSALAPRMAEAMDELDETDIESLVHYYASYRSPD